VITTDDKGRPFDKPARADFRDDVSFVRAFHAYKDAVTRCANAAFDDAFRKEMRR
jgi:hypothetical protein